jgi:predicted Zn-dependent peptidase
VKTPTTTLLAAGLAALALAAHAAPATIPPHPSKLAFAPLEYDAPNRMDYRHELSNGVVAYVVEDHALPLVSVWVTTRAGDWTDPVGKTGLASITADQMRSGGAGTLDADAFDEEVDFLALDMGINSGGREASASVNSLKKDFDRALDLLFMALKEPRFQADRIELYKSRVRQGLDRRNDRTDAIESREWKRLMYGDDHFETRQVTAATLGAITRDDMVAFHRKAWNPANLIVSVTGDVKTADVLAALEKRFAGWAPGEKVGPVPVPEHVPPKGVFIVDKPDVNQSRVSIGHLATTWNDPRRPTLEVMNEILGAGGFSSRIVNSVRTEAGLAYSAGSSLGLGREYPLSFRALFQSKNDSVARAAALTVAELDRMRKEPVEDSEMRIAQAALVDTFPQRFASAGAKASIFVNDEIIGRPPDYWEKYRSQISAVTKDQVKAAATEFLRPDNLTILVVGKKDEVVAGDVEHADFNIGKYAADQGILEIPLPEPATLVYPGPPRPLGPLPKAPSPAPAPAG